MLDFIWKDRSHRRYCWIALVAVIVEWTVFKMIYRYPNLVYDSYAYIRAALENAAFGAWPVGYSRFLQFFSLFSHAANFLVSIQYLFLECSCLLFFFTWLYLFRPGRMVTLILFILLFFNPLFLSCSNYILSDALFVGLSILWLTQLLWIIYRPRPWMILTHAVLLVLAFTVRYNALYYPFIGIFAFLVSRQRPWLKIAGICLPVLLVGAFVFYTGSQVAAASGGQRQFSPFGGWKLVNDALYVYAHVASDHTEPVPEKFRVLDSIIQRYFHTSRQPVDLLEADPSSGSYFMFDNDSPLKTFVTHQYGSRWAGKEWLSVSPLLQSYGFFLIRRHPLAFARYFCWPNFIRYSVPPTEVFGLEVPFYLPEDPHGNFARQMFGLTTITIPEPYIQASLHIFSLYPVFLAIIHLFFFCSLAGFFCSGGARWVERPALYCLILVAALWCCDLCFSILSAAVVLRYQIFIMILEMAFGLFFMEKVYRHLNLTKKPSLA